jgi:PAS domain S-box-containing protein
MTPPIASAASSTMDDVTDQRQIETELRHAEQLARSLLDSTGEGIYGIDIDGICMWANPACLRLVGYQRADQLLGRNMHQLIHHTKPNGDPYPIEDCKIYQASRERRGTHADDELLFRADGSSFPAEYWSFPVLDDAGLLVGGVVTFIDITERRRAEQQLADQAAALGQLARFFEMDPGPVLRTDLDGTILLANAAARRVFGSELVGRNWCATCPDFDQTAWHRARELGETVAVPVRVGGEQFVFTHRRDTADDLIFVFGADVTHEKRAERAMRNAEKMATLGTLAAGVTHELNNPAAAVRRASELLRDAVGQLGTVRSATVAFDEADQAVLAAVDAKARQHADAPPALDPLDRADRQEAVEQWLARHDVPDPWELAPALVDAGFDPASLAALSDRISAQALPVTLAWGVRAYSIYTLVSEIGTGASRISGIVSALKTFAALDQGPLQWVDLHAGLDDTLVMLHQKLADGITVTRDYDAGIPQLLANSGELNLVWTSIIDNAVDAVRGHGTIALRTRRSDGQAIVDIEDNGPGIPADVLSRVFDPFFTTKPPGQGTGLGLSMSYGIIVEKHNGDIHIDSRPGCTRVTVALPLRASLPTT